MINEKNKKFTVEEAYQSLAIYLVNFINARAWQKSGFSAKVTPGSVTLDNHWLVFNNQIDEKALGWGDSNISKNATDAIRFLRDDLLATTGERIWGLTFTLYPNGKFNIEYDYNKPEDYEDTDELMTGEEINQSLSNLNKQA